MTTIVYPPTGRGAFPAAGTGGTLDDSQAKPGRYYAAPLGTMAMPGSVAAGKPATVTIDQFAVWRSDAAIQRRLNQVVFNAYLDEDGVFGPASSKVGVKWQASAGLAADGLLGPASCRALFRPLLNRAPVDLQGICSGLVGWESGWDPGAVGGSTPQDLGLGQLNGPAHPELNETARLDPWTALPTMWGIIAFNRQALAGDLDATIASWNLGLGGQTRDGTWVGARGWVHAGKPVQYAGRAVGGPDGYIAHVRASA